MFSIALSSNIARLEQNLIEDMYHSDIYECDNYFYTMFFKNISQTILIFLVFLTGKPILHRRTRQ